MARAWAEVQVRCLVERHQPGYSADTGQEQVGLGVQTFELAPDFEAIEPWRSLRPLDGLKMAQTAMSFSVTWLSKASKGVKKPRFPMISLRN